MVIQSLPFTYIAFLGSVTLLLQTPKAGELEAEFEREFIIEGNGVE